MDGRHLERVRELTAGIHLRRGQPTSSDAEAFVDLFNATYARKVSTAYYTWQFFAGPTPGTCFFAEHGHRVVAVYGLRPAACPALGPHHVGLAVDLIISPDMQRTGLLLRLEQELEMEAKDRALACIYALPNEAAYRPRVSGLGWATMPSLITQVAVTDGAQVGSDRVTLVRVDRFTEDIDMVGREFQRAHPHVAMTGRTSTRLNWRFADNPWHKYDLFTVRRDADLFGYLVLKIFRDPLTGQESGDIVDLLWMKDDPEALAGMIRWVLTHFREQNVSHAMMWLHTNTILDKIARELGFAGKQQKRYWCCNVLDNAYMWLQDSSRWFMTMADSEVY